MAINLHNTKQFLAALKDTIFSDNKQFKNLETVNTALKKLKEFDDPVIVPMWGAKIGTENIEAAWNDNHPFTYDSGNKFKLHYKLEIKGTDSPDPNGYNILGQVDYQDPNDPDEILYTIVPAIKKTPAGYKFEVQLFWIKSRAWYKSIFLSNDIAFNDEILDIYADIEIINAKDKIYNVEFQVNGRKYKFDVEYENGDYPWQHYPPTNRLGWRYYYPLYYNLFEYGYEINGIKRAYKVTKDYDGTTLHDISGNNGPDIVFNTENKVNTLEGKHILVLNAKNQIIKTDIANLLVQDENNA